MDANTDILQTLCDTLHTQNILCIFKELFGNEENLRFRTSLFTNRFFQTLPKKFEKLYKNYILIIARFQV